MPKSVVAPVMLCLVVAVFTASGLFEPHQDLLEKIARGIAVGAMVILAVALIRDSRRSGSPRD